MNFYLHTVFTLFVLNSCLGSLYSDQHVNVKIKYLLIDLSQESQCYHE